MIDGHRLFRLEIEKLRPVDRQRVAGLDVGVPMQLGLDLVAGRRLDKIDLSLFAMFGTHGEKLARVGRPIETSAVIVVGRAVMAQAELLAGGIADIDVMVLDECLPAAVGRLGR